MLKNKRISLVMLLSMILAIFGGFAWEEMGYAQTTSGMSQDYKDAYDIKHRVVHQPYLDVEVWVDKGEGSTYHPGDDITIYFQASRDCYVVIYDIDTRGYVNLLYPVDPDDDFYVEGERIYKIPDRFDDYELTVDGPDGMEYIQAVASLEPLDLPNFPGEYEYEGQVYVYQLEGEDPFEFMADINSEIACYEYASDVCVFSVEYDHPQWYYHPQVVYVDRPVDLYWGGLYFDYPWGVEVWIDGVFYGLTPITIPALVVGRHYVSFWYHGCWIWRDWCHVRRGHTSRIWADCHHRYRYVRERFVEKSYRAEKAERRRGGDSPIGLVRPIRRSDGKMIAASEIRRVDTDKGYRTERDVKPVSVKERLTPVKLDRKAEARGIRKTVKDASSLKRGTTKERTSVTPTKVKAKRVRVESKELREKATQSKTTDIKKVSKTAQSIKKATDSKIKASKTRISSQKKQAAKPSGSGTKKASSSKASGDKSTKRRR